MCHALLFPSLACEGRRPGGPGTTPGRLRPSGPRPGAGRLAGEATSVASRRARVPRAPSCQWLVSGSSVADGGRRGVGEGPAGGEPVRRRSRACAVGGRSACSSISRRTLPGSPHRGTRSRMHGEPERRCPRSAASSERRRPHWRSSSSSRATPGEAHCHPCRRLRCRSRGFGSRPTSPHAMHHWQRGMRVV